MTKVNHHYMTTGLEFSVPVDTDLTNESSPAQIPVGKKATRSAARTDEKTQAAAEAESTPTPAEAVEPEAAEEPEAADAAEAAEAADQSDEAESDAVDEDDGADGEGEARDNGDDTEAVEEPAAKVRRFSWKRLLVGGLLPALVMLMAAAAGYLKWQTHSAQMAQAAAAQSVQAATESTIAMLAYRPDTVDKALPAAADRLTGAFRNDYTKLIDDVVIPGSKQKKISAIATVPAAASISATENHAVVLVFVNQTTVIDNDPPSNSASSVRITLERINNRWLISQFEPV